MAFGCVGRQLVLIILFYSIVRVAMESEVPGNCPLVDSMSCGTTTLENGEVHAMVPKLVTNEDIWLPDIPELEHVVTHRLICKVPACISNPCQNGATCTETIRGYDCTCTPGFSGATCATESCQEPWQIYEGSCYRLFSDSATFDQALVNCRDIDLEVGQVDLVSIHSDQEFAFIRTLCQVLGSCSVRYWIGLYQPNPDVESAFVWADGTPVDYTFWGPNEPNDSGSSEDCVEARQQNPSIQGVSWNDIPCSLGRSYVCKVTFNM